LQVLRQNLAGFEIAATRIHNLCRPSNGFSESSPVYIRFRNLPVTAGNGISFNRLIFEFALTHPSSAEYSFLAHLRRVSQSARSPRDIARERVGTFCHERCNSCRGISLANNQKK